MLHNRYDMHEELGSGGMGAVYRATDRLTGDLVAIKRVRIMPRDLEFQSRTNRTDPESLRIALAQEFQTLAALRHPHIISVLDYGFDEEHQPYFVMPLIESRQTILEAGSDMTLADKVDLLIQLLQALAYLHRRGILHRDLKPQNVLVSQGVVKVVDFGLAAAPAISEGIAGTIAYMAPERLRENVPVTPAADLYAVGIIAYELLVGHYPFERQSIFKLINDILFEAPDLLVLPNLEATDLVQTVILGDRSQRDVEAPTPMPIEGFNPLAVIIERLLAKDPEARYGDAAKVIEDFNAALGRDSRVETRPVRESFLQAARFVGREAEMTRLEKALQAAVDGKGSAWLIGGESGVGKTRLLDELRIKALVREVMVMRGQTVAEAGPPYQLWRDPLLRLVLASDPSPVQASVIREVAPTIETVLQRPVSPAPPISGEDAQARLIDTILALFRKVSDRPMMLVLEDLQWASTSLTILRQLVKRAASLPLLVVGTYRDDEHPRLADTLPGMKHMKLDRLPPDEVSELSVAMLGNAGRQPEVLDLLQRESEGNVYFLIEVARTLAEEAGGTAAIGSVTLPEHVFAQGVLTVIQRRLEQIPEIGRELLKLAALVGRRLDDRLLRYLHQSLHFEFDYDEWLNIGNNCAVLAVRDGQWWFAHDKLREHLINNLKPMLRSRYHRLVAEAVETVYPDNTDYAALLQRLWAAAGFFKKEAHYALVAGSQALWQGNVNKAIPLLERAMAVRVDEAVYGVLGEAYFAAGNFTAAEHAYEQSLALATARADRPLIARNLRGLGVVTQMVHDDLLKARSFFERSLGLASQLTDRQEVAWSLLALGQLATLQKEYELAEHCFDEALILADDVHDRAFVANLYIEIGKLALNRNDLERAADQYEQALNRYEQMGFRRGVVRAQTELAAIALKRDELATAHQLCREALSKAWELGATPAVLSILANYVALYQKQNELQKAAAIVAIIVNHPARTTDSRRSLAPYVADIGQRQTSDDKRLSQEMAQAMTLEQVVLQLITDKF